MTILRDQPSYPESSPPGGPKGKRLLPHVIDDRAHSEPDKVFYVLTEDLYKRKTRTVTYGDFARAVDRLAMWLDEALGKRNFQSHP